jgi:uncharacterized membrane protein
MEKAAEVVTEQIFAAEWDRLTPHEREVIWNVLSRIHVPRNLNEELLESRTFGAKAADAFARFGGSWTFIFLFALAMALWALVNTTVLGTEAFDPYPFIFLNLMLSMLAAVQAPIIMMSQNRQEARDRLDAEVDHEVNVRAELAIRNVHEHILHLERTISELTGNPPPDDPPAERP